MSTWREFADQAPELAAFGESRYASEVAYLGTVRTDGSPRVHPVTPIIGDQLYLFMEPTSPKRLDLLRDPRYTLHCSVEDQNGGNGEFYVRGRAALTDDPNVRAEAIKVSSYVPRDQYILFVLSVDYAFMNQYIDGKSNVRRWQELEIRNQKSTA
jgi:hypothetical protein